MPMIKDPWKLIDLLASHPWDPIEKVDCHVESPLSFHVDSTQQSEIMDLKVQDFQGAFYLFD